MVSSDRIREQQQAGTRLSLQQVQDFPLTQSCAEKMGLHTRPAAEDSTEKRLNLVASAHNHGPATDHLIKANPMAGQIGVRWIERHAEDSRPSEPRLGLSPSVSPKPDI